MACRIQSFQGSMLCSAVPWFDVIVTVRATTFAATFVLWVLSNHCPCKWLKLYCLSPALNWTSPPWLALHALLNVQAHWKQPVDRHSAHRAGRSHKPHIYVSLESKSRSIDLQYNSSDNGYRLRGSLYVIVPNSHMPTLSASYPLKDWPFHAKQVCICSLNTFFSCFELITWWSGHGTWGATWDEDKRPPVHFGVMYG